MPCRRACGAFALGFVMCICGISVSLVGSGSSEVVPSWDCIVNVDSSSDRMTDSSIGDARPSDSSGSQLRTIAADLTKDVEPQVAAEALEGARTQVLATSALPRDSSTDVHVSGYIEYQSSETLSGSAPVQDGLVKIYDSEVGLDEYLGYAYTSSDGFFEFVVNNDDGALQGGRDLYVKSLSCNHASSVEGWSWTENEYVPYTYNTATWDNAADGSYIDMGTTVVAEKVNAWYLADVIRFAHDWILGYAGYSVDQVIVLWPLPPECDLFTDTPHVHILPNVGEDLDPFHGDIHFPKRTDYNWDRKTIFHEYAHHVMHDLYCGEVPASDVWHWFTPHDPEREEDGAFALIEGWAEFLHSAIEWDVNDPWTGLVSWDLQTIEKNDWYAEDGDALDGSAVEGSVASILWDMFDPVGTIGSMSEDSYGDQLCIPLFEIFQTFLATQMESIYGLWDYWHDLSYISLSQLQSTYEGMYSAFMNYGVCLSSKPLPPLPSIVSPSMNTWYSGVVPMEARFIDPDGGMTRAVFTVTAPDLGTLQFIDSDGSDGWTASWDPSGYSSAVSGVTISVQGVEDDAPGGPLLGYVVATKIGVDDTPPKVEAFSDPFYPSTAEPTILKVNAFDFHSGLGRVTLYGKAEADGLPEMEFIRRDFDITRGCMYYEGELTLPIEVLEQLGVGAKIIFYAEAVDLTGQLSRDPMHGFYEVTIGKPPGKLVFTHETLGWLVTLLVTDPDGRMAGWDGTLVYDDIPEVILEDSDWYTKTITIPAPVVGVYKMTLQSAATGHSYTTTVTSYSPADETIDTIAYSGTMPPDFTWHQYVYLSDNGTLLEDNEPPATELVTIGTRGSVPWYTSDVLVELHAFDSMVGVIGTYYNINGEAVWTHYTEPFTLGHLYESAWCVGFYSLDYCYNIEPAHYVWIGVDKTAPVITGVTLPLANTVGWFNCNVTVDFTAEDAVSGLASATPDQVLTREGTGLYVEGVAVDVAGNTASCNVSGINIDKTPPLVRFVAGQPCSRVEADAVVMTSETGLTLVSLDDVSGCKATYYRIDGGGWSLYDEPLVFGDTEDALLVEAYSVDWADNFSPVESISVVVDSLPTAAFTVSPLKGYVNSTYSFDASCSSDAESSTGSLQMRWDFDGDGERDTNWSAIGLCEHKYSSSGVFLACLEIKDSVGLLNYTMQLVEVLIDSDAPVTSLTAEGIEGLAQWYTSSVSIVLVGIDLESGVERTEYRLDNDLWQLYSDALEISSDGTHLIEYYSRDISGNYETSSESSFKIDQTKPSLEVSGELEDKYTKDYLTISWTASDVTSGVDHYEYSLDAGAFEDIGAATELTLSGLSDGDHSLIIRCVDEAGNTADRIVAFEVNTSVFSMGGPVGPWLLVAVACSVVAAVSVGTFLAWQHKKGGAR